ncbi:protein-disulfide reductase DsbD [Pasteurellaceae bacterium Macca]|nr:protein-disulfide reductase DsbD [Pasteurellaceae bacterium Macca]
MRQIFLVFTSILSLLNSSAMAGLFSSQPKFLTSQEAFVFHSEQKDQQVALQWQIADGYYLYKKEIKVRSQQNELKLDFPQSEKHQDEFFGEVDIFRHQLDLNVPLTGQTQLEVQYQGCTKGFCYPPESFIIDLAGSANSSSNQADTANQAQTIEKSTPAKNPQKTTARSEQDQLAEQLSTNRFSIFWFFVLGVGLAFTPCVLPMLPLLSAIVIGNQQRPNNLRAFLLSLTYVQGMALTYTLLGLVVAAIGLPFQVALQSPPVLIGLAVLFTVLALSMFGLFTLQLPNSWQQKLNNLSQQQQGGSYVSVFFMGVIAGLVASPCTSAPLSGALLYVAQSGDLITGGLALYLLALGMGIPLVLVTLFGNKILPKSGDWLLKVKTLFGFVMLALPVFLLSRVLPSEFEPLMWSALAIAFLIWLVDALSSSKWSVKVLRILALLLLAVSAKPWTDLIFNTTESAKTHASVKFERFQNLTELQQKLSQAKGKKVMVDLFAEWCVACKEFEKYTFSDPSVKSVLEGMVLLQVDMTKNSPENAELMKAYKVLGLPSILFFDENGNELPEARVTGFMPANQFLAWLKQL